MWEGDRGSGQERVCEGERVGTLGEGVGVVKRECERERECEGESWWVSAIERLSEQVNGCVQMCVSE